MKVLIWILTFFVGTLLNTLIGYAIGIRAGAVLLYIAEFFVAKKLSEKWEIKQMQKKSVGERCTYCGYNSFDSDGKCRNCGRVKNFANNNTLDRDREQETENIQNAPREILNTGSGYPKEKGIESAQKTIENHTVKDEVTACTIPQIKYCRICGYELLKGSEFCSRCGTKIEKRNAQ